MWSDVKQDLKRVTDYRYRRCTIQLDRSLWADYYLSVSIVYLDDIRVGGRAECHVV